MFRLAERLSGAPPQQKRYLRRALYFAGGLVLLWLAVQMIPSPAPPPVAGDQTVYTDDAGTVVAKPRAETVRFRREPRLVTPGTFFALVLLVGGGAFALHLRRRRGAPGQPAAFIEPVTTFALAPNQQLRLVRCADEVLLLGVTSGQITLLKSYPADTFDAPEPYPYEEGPGEPVAVPDAALPSHFADVLRHYASRYTPAAAASRQG